jgi:hypothetical protein
MAKQSTTQCSWQKRKSVAGQTMIEYLIVASILMAGVAILAVLIYTLRENGHRVLELAGSEYP